jgi:hypothetical protein
MGDGVFVVTGMAMLRNPVTLFYVTLELSPA